MAGRDVWIRWDRTENEVIGVFDCEALTRLRHAVDWFRQVMVGRWRAFRLDDPTAAALRMPLSTRLVRYPPLKALLALKFPPDTPEWVILWWEPDVVRTWHDAAVMLLKSLPENSCVVSLDDDHVRAWRFTLPLLRISFGVNHGVLDPPEGTTEEGMSMLPADYRPGGTPDDRVFVDWLREITDNLRELAPSATP